MASRLSSGQKVDLYLVAKAILLVRQVEMPKIAKNRLVEQRILLLDMCADYYTISCNCELTTCGLKVM